MYFVLHVTEQPRFVFDPLAPTVYSVAADGSGKTMPPWHLNRWKLPYDAAFFQRFATLENSPPHWRAWAEKLPDYWLSECKDVFLASDDAITLLLESVSQGSRPGGRGGRHGGVATVPQSDPQTTRNVKSKTKLATAMLLVQQNPEWSDRFIAQKAGYKGKSPHSSLSRSKTYQQAAAIARGSNEDLPHGRKEGETGNLEAWGEED